MNTAERLKANRALTILPIAQPKKLSLVSNDDHREVPTEPHNLKPSDPPKPLKTAIPRLQPLPQELIDAIRALPEPNPLSYVDMACALILRGLERQQGIDLMLDAAVDRINEDAEERRRRATADINRNFEFTNHEVQKLGGKVEELDQTVRGLVPRMREVETRLESGSERFERIELDLAAMRTQMDRLEQELSELRTRNGAAPPKT